jgi:hypothetical protein
MRNTTWRAAQTARELHQDERTVNRHERVSFGGFRTDELMCG